MYRNFITLFLMILALASMPGGAASHIELVDGTTINGDVVSISNGRYIIHSTTLGQIEVPESSIRSIRPGGGNGSGSAISAEIQSIQKQILSSPELMQMVTALLSDPELQATINDPELIQLVMSGNLEALRVDPRIHRLFANPSIQAIVGKVSCRSRKLISHTLKPA